MDESTIKGLELNGSDADNRKISRVTMIVSGYDTLLPEEDIKSLLSEHFSSCGEITKVYIPIDVPIEIRNKYAFVYITGENAEEKALQLNGSDVGGRNVVVKVMPPSTEYFDVTPELAARTAELNDEISRDIVVIVTGYDTWLPENSVESSLRKHFSSCGEIIDVRVHGDGNGGLYKKAVLEIRGEGVAEKVRKVTWEDGM